jgi:hypothetical protein
MTNTKTPLRGQTATPARKFTVPIKKPVRRGEGLNDWLYRQAFRLAMEGATAESTARALHKLVGEETRPGELRRQVERAFHAARGAVGRVGNLGGKPPGPAWPRRDDGLLVRFWQDHPATVDDLAAASPRQAPDHPLDVLRELHDARDNELLCLGLTPTGGFKTLTLAQWEDRRGEIPQWQMVVPNLMRAREAINFDGNPSQRCRNNSCGEGGQRFLVIEYDLPPDAAVVRELGARTVDVCAALILHKIGLPRVRMVVHSGGKSLHCWITANGQTHEQIQRIYRVHCLFGGDWRGSLPEQQFRLPNGYRREKDAVQRVIYFNPEGTR